MPQLRRPVSSAAQRRLAAGALVAAAALVTGPAPAAQAAQKKCGRHTGEVGVVLSQDPKPQVTNVFWKAKGKLLSCSVLYAPGAGKPLIKNRVLGPWTKGSQFAMSTYAMAVIWTQRTTTGGVPADRVWAAEMDRFAKDPTFLRGVAPANDAAASTDVLVQGLAADGFAVGWTTTGGAVSFASIKGGRDPLAIGAGTPGALDAAPVTDPATPAPSSTPSSGLFAKPVVIANRAQIGRWTHTPPAALASTLKITEQDGGGDWDDCGGGNPYDITVTPVAAQPAVGTTFQVDWFGDSPACR